MIVLAQHLNLIPTPQQAPAAVITPKPVSANKKKVAAKKKKVSASKSRAGTVSKPRSGSAGKPRAGRPAAKVFLLLI